MEEIQQTTLDKIRTYIKEHRVGLTWILAAILLITTFIALFINPSPRQPIDDAGLIEQPLSFSRGKRIKISDDIEGDFDRKDTSLVIYEVTSTDKTSLIDQFIFEIGIGGFTLTTDSELIKIREQADNRIEYNTLTEELTFTFDGPISLATIDRALFKTDELQDYFNEFIRIYIDPTFEHTNFTVTEERDSFLIEADRKIGDYHLETSGFFPNPDFIRIEKDGDLIEGKILLMSLTDNEDLVSDIIDIDELRSLINSDIYPKEFNQGPIAVAEEDIDLPDPADAPANTGIIPLEAEEIRETNDCDTENIEIVYFYLNQNYLNLSPVYKISCAGVINHRGRTYDVNVIIYANALDPDRVFIPEDIDEFEL